MSSRWSLLKTFGNAYPPSVFCASRSYPTRELIILDIVKLTVFFWISSSSAFANCILQELIFGELPLNILAQPRICLDWGRINIEKQLSLAPLFSLAKRKVPHASCRLHPIYYFDAGFRL